jgi:hypothetical protein
MVISGKTGIQATVSLVMNPLYGEDDGLKNRGYPQKIFATSGIPFVAQFEDKKIPPWG